MDNVNVQRRRGRPKGSTRYAGEDAVALAKVADLLWHSHGLTRTAAIKQVTGRPNDDSSIRRLRNKLDKNWHHLMRAAQLREQAPTVEIQARPAPTLGNALILLGQRVNQLEDWWRSPKVQAGVAKIGDAVVRLDAFMKTPEGQKLMRDISALMTQQKATPRRQISPR